MDSERIDKLEEILTGYVNGNVDKQPAQDGLNLLAEVREEEGHGVDPDVEPELGDPANDPTQPPHVPGV